MGWTDKLNKYLRSRKLRFLLRGQNPDAAHVTAAVDEIIDRARRDERAGVSKPRWLFDFESSFEVISDAVTRLRDDGETEAYRNIYAKLYAFAEEKMTDSYMPLYLSVLYRYADARRSAGETEEALELFEELYTGTDRLIGLDNPYGIHCLEEIAKTAALCGRKERTESALLEMRKIAEEEFGPRSAMAQAVQRIEERLSPGGAVA